ncbi:MAG: TonB-dependent receptor plug domain-containing protein [Porphyromonas sp.]|nr:TonB-dependent receptor plug domain-containing protein [Porphyromonas sp.]
MTLRLLAHRVRTLILLSIALSSVALAQQREQDIEEVVVWGRRPLKEIGVQKTQFDSLALKENVALSMADILTFNSSVFVKSYGRATLSTVAFRGTSPSHTRVTWNGMRINNPMLGMTDFSTIPSYFIDRAALLHGTSSVNATGGGLGGLVELGTAPTDDQGFAMQYVQGVGSFSTFDEFLRLTYGNERWSFSTRAVYSSSPNDYEYTNRDKKVNIYDEEKNIIGQYHPRERNRSASFKDLHLLQEVYYNNLRGDRLGLNAWYIQSDRELPMLTTDYGDEMAFENRQRERTFRGILSWDRIGSDWKVGAKAGYIHTWMAYDYQRQLSKEVWGVMTRSRSRINTLYGQAVGEYTPSSKWFFTTNLALYQHMVRSEDNDIIRQDGNKAVVGYDKARVELSGALSAKWQPTKRLGMSLVLRQEMSGDRWAPLIPAFFIDGVIYPQGNVLLKASISRNHRFPSLNDLYFLPGGNPDLKNESGFTYDIGVSYEIGKGGRYRLSGSASWFDSYIDDWIIWLPTAKGFFSPRNVKSVHAYGVELKNNLTWKIAPEWLLDLNGSYSWTPSINVGEKMTPADQSVGKQLPYVPEHSAALTSRLSWRSWSLLYKWVWYSERYTMSSNEYTLTGRLPQYFMNNVALERQLRFKPMDLQVKLSVNNLFDEEYLSVLSRPMPGINFELFLAITPKW